ncbi:serine-type D-Ala-D-Ala carboxypeptidase [Actibacterium pelagium]|uniref:Serine-type D-Ala-D-Ala carboxypeptidase n=2 Tax=Actibacterium pelagium TaxID=2029103 RepID=A0A917AG27_9RHOB|nr:serine-type D-Ala-D-Ala carboxypeptidase [Actibacterium pelagium]
MALMLASIATTAQAAPYAAMVIDARSGEVLHSRNADTRLHPASLTKMMTLYIAFEAVENGEISLDTKVRISKKAAAEPPSKLGLRSGQRIAFRYLIRAAAVKSANDAATAIGEALEGSEAAFARRMNRTAKALGMSRTTFKNAHGLTESGHMSTARDMTTLGRHLFYDYPEYYNLFSRLSTHAGIKNVPNTNRRLLNSYRGADGIKTGYTRAAGFNLVASAQRGQERIIATVFGGRSSATRNARVAELLNMGFNRAPSRVAVRKPSKPNYRTGGGNIVTVSIRPTARPANLATPSTELLLALKEGVEEALQEAQVPQAETELAELETAPETEAPAEEPVVARLAPVNASIYADIRPTPRPARYATLDTDLNGDPVQEVVTRMSSSGGRHWGVNIGHFTTQYEAERVLLQTALRELGTLDSALRKVTKNSRGWSANFVGMTQEEAALACRRLESRGNLCKQVGPPS